MSKIRLGAVFAILCISVDLVAQSYTSISPGADWRDTNGQHINAHGGCVVYQDGLYYWFGEDRTAFYSNGVGCYKSSDLYNWTKVGIVFAPSGSQRDDMNDFAPGRLAERPKVIYNDSTQKYILWAHWERSSSDYGAGRVVVAQSDNLTGPYEFYKTFRPNNHDSRDQTLYKDDDGTAYHFGSTDVNTNMNVCILRGDYLEPSSIENKVLKSQHYEAPAIVKRGDYFFGIFSGATGWDPNPAKSAYTTDPLRGWKLLKNPAVDDNREVTYYSQSCYIFKVAGRDNAYVYMGDRWNRNDPGSSDYVWLPLNFRSGIPTINWYDSWDLSVFDDMYRYKRTKEIESGNVYTFLEKYSNRLFSKDANGFITHDDDDVKNAQIILESTGETNTYKLKDKSTGNYLQSTFGSLTVNGETSETNQEWIFVSQQNGYYYITNKADNKAFTVSGSSTRNNANIYLTEQRAGLHQDFAVYFDSYNYDYEEADMFEYTEVIVPVDTTDTDTTTVKPVLAVDTIVDSKFMAYPSVCNGNFTVLLEKAQSEMMIQMFSITGEQVILNRKTLEPGEETHVSLRGVVPGGVYVIIAEGNQQKLSTRIIIR
ncbi:MAG: family 43 glycosylhydrolase [Cyclobacteriaceae bacterium]